MGNLRDSNRHKRKNEKNKSRFEKEKLKSAFFVYVEKIKPFLLLIHKSKSKIKNGFFYCLKGGMQNVEVRNNKKFDYEQKIKQEECEEIAEESEELEEGFQMTME